jgi:hypothetical protein
MQINAAGKQFFQGNIAPYFGVLKGEAKTQLDAIKQEEADRFHYSRYPGNAVDYQVALLMDPQSSATQRSTAQTQLSRAVGNNPLAAYYLLARFSDEVMEQVGGVRKISAEKQARLPKELILKLIGVLDNAPETADILLNPQKALPKDHLSYANQLTLTHFKPSFGPEADTAYLKMLFRKTAKVPTGFSAEKASPYQRNPLNEEFLFSVLKHQVQDVRGDADVIREASRRLVDIVKTGLTDPKANFYEIWGDNGYRRAMSVLNTLREEFTKTAPPRGLVEDLLKIAETNAESSRFWGRRDNLSHYDSTFPPDLERRYYLAVIRDPKREGSEMLWIHIIDHFLRKSGDGIVRFGHPDHPIYQGAVTRLMEVINGPAPAYDEQVTPSAEDRQRGAREVLKMMDDPAHMQAVAPEELVKPILAIATEPVARKTEPPAPDFSQMMQLSDLSEMASLQPPGGKKSFWPWNKS